MNKLPTKQIYLLIIIIVGIIALSVYSTYALFTFEGETSEIVSIHIPKSLTISENIYEYQQIKVSPNTIATTDIDIYNTFDYEVCYSVWYKVVGDKDTQNKVQVFEQTEETLSASGLLPSSTNKRITLVIINDNNIEIKINLGTISAQKENNGSCSLNISSDKNTVSASYKNIDILTTKLLGNKDTPLETEENYLTYKEQTEDLVYKNTDKIYTSNKFTYSQELFTLTDAKQMTIAELLEQNTLQDNDIYICQNDPQCRILHKIKLTDIEKIENEIIGYKINKYDKLIGYAKGTNGLRKINEKDYVYYGDNPNNFIYYNCGNNDNLNTCELWRIVGFFYNEQTDKYNTKIVRNDSIGKYQFDYKLVDNENASSNMWNSSTLHKYLNEDYTLKNNYEIYLDKYTQLKERIKDLETDVKNIKVSDENIDSAINLLNLSDFLYASSCEKSKINEYSGECITNNWLNNIEISKEWTLTSKEIVEVETPGITEENKTENNEITEIEGNTETVEETTEEPGNTHVINYIYSIGKDITETDVNEAIDVRPVVFLKSRMLLLDGNGSLESPYVIK